MDVEAGSGDGWTTESIAAAEGMVVDTGTGADAGAVPMRAKSSKAKRGAKSKAQKRRAAARVERGVSHALRMETKATKTSGGKAQRKASTKLWSK
ncbi:hypothetical protein QBZ16_001895 [Prototheca wickerhamii]|uniref:Uncharacterized protein n=1 Tax=Prototheca wickerhamii TaxID=3111 RepID=A0AAD9MNT1_PROWI|nr:hypothetical protein QBZ16_001895 [Prototheca wickerhamii]